MIEAVTSRRRRGERVIIITNRAFLAAAFLATACGLGDGGSTEGSTGTSSASSDTSSGDTTTGDEDKYLPWYGPWYATRFAPNEPVSWVDGGDNMTLNTFEFYADRASFSRESCYFGLDEWEYRWYEGEDGRIILEPVDGVHAHNHGWEISEMYLEFGEDCSSLTVWALVEGDKRDFFVSSSNGGPLQRGELCLEQCATSDVPAQDGLISDCGVPVPWACEGP